MSLKDDFCHPFSFFKAITLEKMDTMENILLPTDFSANSRAAIEYAFQLFKGAGKSFYFLNVQKSSEFITDDLIDSSAGT